MMKSLYYEGNSLLHHLNPLTKIIATAPVIVFLALVTDPWTPMLFILLYGLTTVILGRIPVRQYLKTVAPMLFFVTGFLIVYPIVVSSERVAGTPIVLELGPLVVRWGGVVFGIATALRVISLILGSLLFVLTTDSGDFIRALIQQWRLPYRIGYGAMAAYRFVPMLNSELAVIQAAHKVRGISDKGGLRAQYERVRRYAVPLLATAIRKAERTALAMDGRAFGAFDERTYYRHMAFAARDWWFIVCFWIVSLALILILKQTGLLGPLVLLQNF
jgi:energy-coupling factor transport system permease protein